jgi:hypothetical protein
MEHTRFESGDQTGGALPDLCIEYCLIATGGHLSLAVDILTGPGDA